MLRSQGYTIFYDNNATSEKWGKYLFQHLSRRLRDSGEYLLLGKENEHFKKIIICVQNTLEYDYSIKHTSKNITLEARSEETIKWLIYQLMKQLANEDNRFIADDLPPVITGWHTHTADFSFEYREPYFNPNLQEDYAPIIGTNMVENDWGIWGHNLHKILRDNDSGISIYAETGNGIKTEQFCFSNKEVFIQLKEYIIDNYGYGNEEPKRFMIMPNDNNIVCCCKHCNASGNTVDNATPALSILIQQLAGEFPAHQFFTTSYQTTHSPPKNKWPSNTGVMISTINLPKGIALEEDQNEVKSFLQTLTEWKSKTSNIYIWDYAANFDDYLTPLPILYSLKKQLQFYKSIGVKGVFLNASGYDYSPFDDMKTFVASALMINTNLSVDSLCKQYFKQFYPESGKVLNNYYLSLEKEMEKNNKPYNLYGCFQDALKTYLNKEAFVAFYDSLENLIYSAKEEEKIKLEQLYTALSYSRLQLAYVQRELPYGFAVITNKSLDMRTDIKKIYKRLSMYEQFKNLINYKESNGDLESYLNNWEKMLDEPPARNLLINEHIEILSKPDEDYANKLQMLNDGVPGFEKNYQQGWYISSIDDLHIQMETQNLAEAKNISLRCLIDEVHHIYPPSKIELYKNNSVYKVFNSSEGNCKQDELSVATYSANIDINPGDHVTLKIYRNKEYQRSSIACDEIRLY